MGRVRAWGHARTAVLALRILLGATTAIWPVSAFAADTYLDGSRYGTSSSSEEAQKLRQQLEELRRTAEAQAKAGNRRITFKFGDLHFNANNATGFLNYVSIMRVLKSYADRGYQINVVEMGDLLNWDAGYKNQDLNKLGEEIKQRGDKEAYQIYERWRRSFEGRVDGVKRQLTQKGVSEAFARDHLDNWARYGAMEGAFAELLTETLPPDKGHHVFHLTGNHGIHYNDAIRAAQAEWDAKRNVSALHFLLKLNFESAYTNLILTELKPGESAESKRKLDALKASGTQLVALLEALNKKHPELGLQRFFGDGSPDAIRAGMVELTDPRHAEMLSRAFSLILKDKPGMQLAMAAMGQIQDVAEHRHTPTSQFMLRAKIVADMAAFSHLNIGEYPYSSTVDADGRAVADVMAANKDSIPGHTTLTKFPEEVGVVSRSSTNFVRPEDVARSDYRGLKGETGEAYVHYPIAQGDYLNLVRHLFYSLKKTPGNVPNLPSHIVNQLNHGDDHSRTMVLGPDRFASLPAGFLVADTGTAGSWIKPGDQSHTMVVSMEGRTFYLNIAPDGKGEAPMTLLTPVQTNTALPPDMSMTANNRALLARVANGRAATLLMGGLSARVPDEPCPLDMARLAGRPGATSQPAGQ